jgi:integrase
MVRNAGVGEHFDAKIGNLGLRVSPKGRRTWFVRYMVPGGKRKREGLGIYPEVSLGEARRRAKVRMGEVSGHVDRWMPPKAVTFKDGANDALDLMEDRTSQRTDQFRRRILEFDLLPEWGDRLASDITRGDVVALVRKVAARGSPVMANRTLSLIRALFNAMLDLELVEANPAARPKRFYMEEKPRERVLTKPELKRIFKAVADEGPEAGAFFELVAFTAQRVGAVAASKWEEYDFLEELWTLPVEEGRKIQKYPRKVPLNRGALEALRTLAEQGRGKGLYLFPSRKGSKQPHYSNWGNMTRRLRKQSGVDGWTLHDLRRTFRTIATGALDIDSELADLCLSHDLTTVGHTHYQGDKPGYRLPEKREAFDSWGEFLEGFK